MNAAELTQLTTFALGFLGRGLVITAGVTILGTGYTIVPHRLHKLKTRA
jgi:hypothetical protein